MQRKLRLCMQGGDWGHVVGSLHDGSTLFAWKNLCLVGFHVLRSCNSWMQSRQDEFNILNNFFDWKTSSKYHFSILQPFPTWYCLANLTFQSVHSFDEIGDSPPEQPATSSGIRENSLTRSCNLIGNDLIRGEVSHQTQIDDDDQVVTMMILKI